MSHPADTHPASCEQWVQGCLHKIEHHLKKVNHAALDKHKHILPDVKVKYEKDLHTIHKHYTIALPKGKVGLGRKTKDGPWIIEVQFEHADDVHKARSVLHPHHHKDPHAFDVTKVRKNECHLADIGGHTCDVVLSNAKLKKVAVAADPSKHVDAASPHPDPHAEKKRKGHHHPLVLSKIEDVFDQVPDKENIPVKLPAKLALGILGEMLDCPPEKPPIKEPPKLASGLFASIFEAFPEKPPIKEPPKLTSKAIEPIFEDLPVKPPVIVPPKLSIFVEPIFEDLPFKVPEVIPPKLSSPSVAEICEVIPEKPPIQKLSIVSIEQIFEDLPFKPLIPEPPKLASALVGEPWEQFPEKPLVIPPAKLTSISITPTLDEPPRVPLVKELPKLTSIGTQEILETIPEKPPVKEPPKLSLLPAVPTIDEAPILPPPPPPPPSRSTSPESEQTEAEEEEPEDEPEDPDEAKDEESGKDE